ncbi:MAG TPA: FtsX-like permease family protein, partial [Actinopolymorphaceae bacterium]|nr:FtsX-like permease family protein [Actinopolymorphaceae bacterium]
STLSAQAVGAIRGVRGVRAAAGLVTAGVQVGYAGRGATTWAQISNLPSDVTLRWQRVASGRLPERQGEVAVDAETAGDRHLRIGSSLSVRSPGAAARYPLRVVGLLQSRSLPPGVAFAATDGTLARLSGHGAVRYDEVIVQAVPGTDLGRLSHTLARAAEGGDNVSRLLVQSGADRTRDRLADLTGSVNILGGFVVSFAVIAVFVASLVVANTFRILVAQRTRELALLRCVGARRGQVFRSMLAESAVLGVGASVAGLGVGAGLAAAASALLPYSSLRLPRGSLHLDAVTIAVPLVVGVLTTVAAAMVPAHRATRVPPLAALRPELAVRMRTRAGVVRAAAGVILVVGGSLLVWSGTQTDIARGLAFGIGGGVLSFLGIVLVGPLVTPRLVGVLGIPAGMLGGVPARLATANAVRNPVRTAATATALLIGVTLISLMSVGSASVQRTVHASLDGEYPLDLVVRPIASGPAGTSVPASVVRAVGRVDGVAAVTQVRKAKAGTVTVLSGPAASRRPPSRPLEVVGLDPSGVRRVLRDTTVVADLRDGSAIVPQATAKEQGLSDGMAVRLETAGGRLDVRIHVVPTAPDDEAILTATDLRRLVPAAPVGSIWARTSATADAGAVVAQVQQALPAAADMSVEGGAPQRALYDRLLDVLLLVATALLGVAVVIALVGVGNTLSLSVIERIREQALLRALGLTARQLRAMLAVEAVLVTGAAAVAGIALGIGYGAAGTTILLGTATDDVSFVVPVGRLAVVAVAALLAGLAASVLPARRAVRTPPAAALGEE